MAFETLAKQTGEETKKAEEILDIDFENRASSNVRSALLEEIKEKSGLSYEVADQVVESFFCEENEDGTLIKFKVNGREILLTSKNGVYDNVFVDGKRMSDDMSERIWSKYERAITDIRHLSFEKIEGEKISLREKIIARDLDL